MPPKTAKSDADKGAAAPQQMELIKVHPEVELPELIHAMGMLLKKENQLAHHQIAREAMSVRERMSMVLFRLQENSSIEFNQLFTDDE